MWESEPLKAELTCGMSKFILCFIMWSFLFRWVESEKEIVVLGVYRKKHYVFLFH